MSKTSSKTTVEWNNVNWKQLQRRVFKLQNRIYRASNRGDIKAVRKLQKTLTRSWAAKMIAVRKVTQDNQGKRTAGVDGIKSVPPMKRLEMVQNLKLSGKCKPTRRVWIPKPGSEEKRPLGIPCMIDRAKQAIVKLALEPEWEAKFEPNSYGFRPGRSCHDAIQQLYLELKGTAKYVLDADIAKCFDRINHETLLKKINTYPGLRKQIKAWLKAGVMDNEVFEETEAGTPQGGVISPLLANIALHGMEYHINGILGKTKRGKENPKAKIPHLIRYADDLVILHKELDVILKCKEAIEEWLKPLGLELKPSKTRICHSLNEWDGEKPGFNFLGFNIRHYQTGKIKALRCKGKNLGYTLTIKPSKEKVHLHSEKLKDVVRNHKAALQSALIGSLNPIIKGWSNYYKTVVSKKTFSRCDKLIWLKLRAWGKSRHRKKSLKWIARKYWKDIEVQKIRKGKVTKRRRNTFCTRDEETGYQLFKHADTPIERFVKVQRERSPYDGDWVYWSSRMGKHPLTSSKVANLLKKQKGKCSYCNLHFTTEDLMEVDHITPRIKGGKDTYDNLQLLHKHCHDSKTACDGSYEDVSMTMTS